MFLSLIEGLSVFSFIFRLVQSISVQKSLKEYIKQRYIDWTPFLGQVAMQVFYSSRETNGISINEELLTPLNMSFLNQTTALHSQLSLTAKILLGIPYVLTIILGSSGNIMAILTIILHEKMQNVANIFLLNLSIADLVVTGICMPAFFGYQIVFYPNWQFDKYSCKILNYLVQVSVLCSVLTLLSIATHRYIILLHGNRSIRYSGKRMKSLLFIIWIIAASFTIGTILRSQIITISFQNSTKRTCLEVHESSVMENISLWFKVVSYFGTVGLLILSYARIAIYLAVGTVPKTPPTLRKTSFQKNELKKKKVIHMLMTATVTFVIGWLPYIVLVLCNLFPPWTAYKLPSGIDIFANFFGMANSAIDPYIYYYFNKNFRKGFINTGIRIRKTFRCELNKISDISETHDNNMEIMPV